MITYKRYNDNDFDAWEEFVGSALNATIFHSKVFLSYHIERTFKDHSLMFYKKNKLIGVFPASETSTEFGAELFSHPGASFGGIIYKDNSLSNMMQMIGCVEQYASENSFQRITTVPTPSVYMQDCDESQIYSLCWNDYSETEQYYASIIPIMDNLDAQIKAIHKNKSRSNDYYDNIIKSNALSITWDNDFDSFYPILLKNKKMHNSSPTHTLEELKKINKVLPDKLKLLLIKKDDEVIGGNLIFKGNSRVAIIFYNMINHKYADLQIATIQVMESIKWAHKKKISFLDFGVSHEPNNENPLIPKLSLIKFKEEFGAFGMIRSVLSKQIDD